MPELLPAVEKFLKTLGIKYQSIDCDPELADTAAFCEHYGYSLGDSANTIIVVGKTDPAKFVACVLLATTKLDVNKKVCALMGVKKASFASGDQTVNQTGMKIGGVTVFGITSLPIYVDNEVMSRKQVIMGSGNRLSKLIIDPRDLTKLPNVEVVTGLAKPKE